MRKFILFCLALAMVVTSVPAMAASDVDFKGFVRVTHQNLYNFNRHNSDTGWRDSDSFFTNRIQFDLNFLPTEDITVFWRIRSVHNVRWGAQNPNSASGAGTSGLWTQFLYAEIRQPWGTVQIGRTADGAGSNAGGLASLGYGPSWGAIAYANPFDIGDVTDAVIYSYDFGNGFSLGVFYAKDNYTTSSEPSTNQGNSNIFPDQDADRFGIEGVYKWDTGGFSLGVAYSRDTTDRDVGNASGRNLGPLAHPEQVSQDYTIHINPALVQAWGAFSIHFEGDIAFSKTVYADACYNTTVGCGAGGPVADREELGIGLGLYLDFNYNYGAGDITLMGWYAQGDPWDNYSNYDRGIVGMGDFAPFLVAYYATSVGGPATYRNSLGISRRDDEQLGQNNQWGLGLLGNHSINDDISLNWGLGYIRVAEALEKDRSLDVGFEIDLGFKFQIIDNLTFDTQLGYMFNGLLFERDIDVSGRPDGTFAWANFLTVSF